MSDNQKSVDPMALLRLEVLRLFLANRPEDCEVIKCLDTKTGLTRDVLFIPAMDPDTGDTHMTPAFAIPESNLSDQEDRYIPLDTLPKTSPIDFKNN